MSRKRRPERNSLATIVKTNKIGNHHNNSRKISKTKRNREEIYNADAKDSKG
uniref:Uncharacterized protein n=1 Tax=Romanomermis culicivorax TaxID=13658 RepID=A0A915L4U7_ROMCU